MRCSVTIKDLQNEFLWLVFFQMKHKNYEQVEKVIEIVL